MTKSVISGERFEMGRVVARTLSVIGGHPLPILGLALIVYGLPSILGTILLDGGNVVNAATISPKMFLGWVSTVLASSMLQATVTRAAIDAMNGKAPLLGESLSTGLKLILPVLGTTLLVTVCAVLGGMMLIVPGLIILMMWSVAIPGLVAERLGCIAALRRSEALTAGSRWRIFGLFVASYGLYLLLFVATGFVQAASSGTLSTMQVLVSTMLGAIFAVIQAVGACAMYAELREVKEGATPGDLAAIFA